MNHPQTIDRFLAFTEGRLSDAARTSVEQHLASCSSCRDSYALLRHATANAAQPPHIQPDPHLPGRIRAIVDQRAHGLGPSWVPALRWSAISFGIGVAVVMGIVLGRGLSQGTAAGGTTTDDLVSVFAASITSADPGDQWSSAAGINGEDQP